MPKVLAKDNEFFLNSVELVLEDLDIVNALLELLVVFLLECIDIKHEQVSIVAADPGEIFMHSTAEKAMATRLLHYDRTEVLIINMELVAFPAREDHARVVGHPR